jgi:hypothetical protein
MKILLHICCGPCAVYPHRALAAAGHEVTGYFYNPNIQPYQEFARRVAALEEYAGQAGLPVVWRREYDLEEFLRLLVFREAERCRFCYRMRLAEAAHAARQRGCDAFSSTLLYSKYQNHGLIREVGEALAAEVGVPFHYEDFRTGWQEGVDAGRALKLYRQAYCGCIYSERDRYERPRRGAA